MINDYAATLRRPRRRNWQRDPRVVLAGAATATAGFVLLGGSVYGASGAGQPIHVTVHAGDSLWRIAAVHSSDGNIRDRVDQIESLNHLDRGTITPGEDLLLPAP